MDWGIGGGFVETGVVPVFFGESEGYGVHFW